MKEYEIWIGNHCMGTGFDSPIQPKMIAKETAINFEIACLKHELRSSLANIEKQEKEGYVCNQSKEWFYNWKTISNSWTGKYFSTREEALKSFEEK